MQKLFDGWRDFRSNTLIENVLNEVSYEYAEHVEDFLVNKGGYAFLPFGDLFGNQSRVVIPFGQAINPGSEIHRIMSWLESQGYEVDFKTGLASKEFESYTGNPNDPNTKKVMRMKQQKIGKVLQRAFDLSLRVTDTQANLYSMRRAFYERNPDRPQGVMRDDELQKDPAFAKATKAFEKAEQDYQKHFSRATPYPTTLQNYVEYWNKNSRYFRENPEEAFVDYSIVISRHPVDVLRMSDHRTIESCHSEGNSHFHCAIKEAKSAGAIAYIVETEDLDDVDIENDNEIFEDNDRGIDGIEPVGRTRLRRFDKTGTFTSDEKYSLLIPEKRIYGQDMAGFYEKIRDWALESQKDKWSQALVHDVERETDENPDPMKMDPDYLRDFVYMGGEYQDTNSRRMFKSFFADYGGADFEHASGGRYGDDEEEERSFVQQQDPEYYYELIQDYSYRLDNQAENAAYKIDEEFIVQSFEYRIVDRQNPEGEWTNEDTMNLMEYFDDWADDEGRIPQIFSTAIIELKIPLNGPNADEFYADEFNADKISTKLGFSSYGYSYHAEIEEDDGYAIFRMMVEFLGHSSMVRPPGMPTGEDSGLTDDYETFCGDILRDQNNRDELREAFMLILQEGDFAQPGLTDLLKKDIEEKRKYFKNFLIRPHSDGSYSLKYMTEYDSDIPDYEREPDDDDPEDEGVRYDKKHIEVAAGRMPTMQLLHAKYGDVQRLNMSQDTYQSMKFTSDVLRRLVKLFAKAHVSAKRQAQQKLGLNEQQTQEIITADDIRTYMIGSFTLGFKDIRYEKASGRGEETISDYTPKIGVPIKTILAQINMKLDDEPYEGSYEKTEQLFKASINFVQMLDEDLSPLTEEISGILQTISPKQEQAHSDKGLKIKGLFQDISELGNKIDNEIDTLVRAYRDDPSKIDNLRIYPERLQSVTAWFSSTSSSPPPRTGQVKPSKWSIRALGTRLQYRRRVFNAFKNTMMEQYVEDRLDILDDLERVGNDIRNMDDPKRWGNLTDQHYKGYQGAIQRMLQRWNSLQTAEELSKLFEGENLALFKDALQ